jgi:hypothetical protein
MKQLIAYTALLIVLFSSSALYAQDDGVQAAAKVKQGTTFNLGPRGFKLTHDMVWLHTNPSWVAKDSYYAMKRIDSNDYVYTIPNLRSYYGLGIDTQIKDIAIIFKDSLGEIQTGNMFIPVGKTMTADSKPSNHTDPTCTTIPPDIIDSTESITIHFHPYDSRHGGDALKNFQGTIFIYTGIITDPPTNDHRGDKDKEEGDFETHWGVLDLGINTISDNTNYNSPAVRNFLNVPANRQNAELFKLRQGKSININIYPWMQTLYAVKRRNQKINISTGIGLQLYNFRYENPITYNKNPGSVTLDNSSFKKDKLGFDYLNIPLMITFKTRVYNNKWLVYGVGITGGYSIATWTKQEAGGQKNKVHDDFSFADFNSCLTGEIGISPGIRFYFSYQLTNMFDNTSGMNQHPVSFGIRFFAI